MYIDKEKWKKLIENFKLIYNGYDNFSDNVKDLIDNVDISIEEIEKTNLNKVYVITNNAICDDEVDYNIKGVAFTKSDANKLFEQAIYDAKIDCDFNWLDAIDVSNNKEISDGKWHYSKSNNFFELYLDGEYNSNNFTIEIKEFDIDNCLNKNKDGDIYEK